MTDPDDPLLGRVLGDKYRLENLIGRGGFGAVYRATQHPLGHTVAVKVLMRNDGPGRGAMRDRFFREGRTLTRLKGRSCVVMHDFAEEPDGLLYMVQELLDGRTLTDALAAGEAFSATRIAHIGGQILDALDEAHGLGIVHRDIKPENVMLVAGRDGEEVRVLDFGIAKVLDPADDPDGATTTGHLIGTPAYMAPEQALQQKIGPPVDLYALGVVLYHLAVGTVPFGGRSTFEILRHHVETPPPRLDAVSPALRAVIGRALEKRPDDRYPSAREMRAALLAAGQADAGAPSRDGAAVAVMAPTEAASSVDVSPPAISVTGPTMAASSTTDETRGAVPDSPPTTLALDGPAAGPRLAPMLAIVLAIVLGAVAWTVTRRGPIDESDPPTIAPAKVGVAPASPSPAAPVKIGVTPTPPRAVIPAAVAEKVGVAPAAAPPAVIPPAVAPAVLAPGPAVIPNSIPMPSGMRYRARLSARDHENSRGVPLRTAADVIRQDRANVHRYGVRDADDAIDGLYGGKAARALMPGRLSGLDADIARRIMEGTPLVEVTTVGERIRVRIIED